MYRTSENRQGNLFSDFDTLLTGKALKRYNDPSSWYNLFYDKVTSKIKEELFKPLFKEGNMGAPNASLRALVAISCIKEGMGISDEELFSQIDYNITFRTAIGARSFEDKLPSLDTYYLFRRRISRYMTETGIDLMDQCFQQSSRDFLCDLNISGKHVRMDSKLIGSNIAWYSRYEIVQKMIAIHAPGILSLLNPSLRKKVECIMDYDSKSDIYRLTKDEIQTRFAEMGKVLYMVLVRIKATEDNILRRLFNDQYNLVKGNVDPKDSKDISADSIQNPFDTDATYRKKNDQIVKGYSTNITETIEEDKPSIITDVEVKPATASDNNYLQQAIENTEKVSGNSVVQIYADGAYQSEQNREFVDTKEITFTTCGIQGKSGRYDYKQNSESEVEVFDKKTGKIYKAKHTKGKSWYFFDDSGEKHYFHDKAIEISQLRHQIESTPMSEMNKRNNVEATMFLYSFHTRNGKTRYRGHYKHKLHAYARCMWINFRRTMIFLNGTEFRRPIGTSNGSICPSFVLGFVNLWKTEKFSIQNGFDFLCQSVKKIQISFQLWTEFKLYFSLS